ncbi:RHS repeat-associated core domain-containing protein [Streptomyces sp. NPDC005202]|uniref:RHS repeat-associated core domain-containing protein n=1 Tax=Streptomyces sp. NPDC005202 TaxID=3157021 RepID=UPI00339F7360
MKRELRLRQRRQPTHASAPTHEAPGDRSFDGTLVRRTGNTTYEHDNQGRLVVKRRKLLNGQYRTWAYTWNAEDRLTEVLTPDGGRWRYAYDPLGRRIAKYRCDEDGSETDRTEFVWDTMRLAEQHLRDGRVTTWDYAPDSHRPLTQTDHRRRAHPQGSSYFAMLADDTTADRTTRFQVVITDAIGTPTELVTAQGEMTWQRRTSLWGSPLPGPAEPTSTSCPLRFPGQYADAETGLHYAYFRYYDPQTACYLSQDPLGLKPAPNPTAYIRHPGTWSDPLGLYGCELEDLGGSWHRSPKGLDYGGRWHPGRASL